MSLPTLKKLVCLLISASWKRQLVHKGTCCTVGQILGYQRQQPDKRLIDIAPVLNIENEVPLSSLGKPYNASPTSSLSVSPSFSSFIMNILMVHSYLTECDAYVWILGVWKEQGLPFLWHQGTRRYLACHLMYYLRKGTCRSAHKLA